jgi:hypothetical protein
MRRPVNAVWVSARPVTVGEVFRQLLQRTEGFLMQRVEGDDVQVLLRRLLALSAAMQGARKLEGKRDRARPELDDAAPDIDRFLVSPRTQQEAAKAAQSCQLARMACQGAPIVHLGTGRTPHPIEELAEPDMPPGNEQPPVAARPSQVVVCELSHISAITPSGLRFRG